MDLVGWSSFEGKKVVAEDWRCASKLIQLQHSRVIGFNEL